MFAVDACGATTKLPSSASTSFNASRAHESSIPTKYRGIEEEEDDDDWADFESHGAGPAYSSLSSSLSCTIVDPCDRKVVLRVVKIRIKIPTHTI